MPRSHRAVRCGSRLTHRQWRDVQPQRPASGVVASILVADADERECHGIESRLADRFGRHYGEIAASAAFILIGALPRTDWLPPEIERDEGGFVRTGGRARTGQPDVRGSPLETSLPGVFAVGDVRSDSIKRVASAVGEGSVAVRYVHEYLAGPAA